MKKFLLFFSALVCSVALSAKTIYFAAGDWDQGSAKFAVYHWVDGEAGAFLSDFMAKDAESGYYMAEIPDASTGIIFVRMTDEATVPGWDPKWNQTEDLTPGENNLFTFTSWDGGKDGKSTGTWSAYTPGQVIEEVYEMKHGWKDGEGASWSYKKLTANEDGTYSIRDIYGGTGCNWKSTKIAEQWVGSPTLVGNPAKGDSAIFTLTSTENGGAITITKIEGGTPINPGETVYVVTGGSGVIFGTTWDNNSACVLAKQADGSYAWTKTDVELTASTIEYKYLEKGTWTGWQLPVQGNASFTIDKSGKYDLTFTLSADLSTQDVKITLKEEVEVKSLIKCLHGNFTGTWNNTEKFTYNAEKTEATLTLALEADKDCEFGMRFSDADWKANGATLTAENNSTNITEGSGNMHIVTTVAGNYVFKYVNETNILSVTYPQATSFESANSEVTATKVVRDGQVLIVREGVAYTLMGQVAE